MRALVIIAHGSRREESNHEIVHLTNEVRSLVKNEFEIVEYSFLEMAKPLLIDAIENIIFKEASEITIFPYFLNSGVHIKNDIPHIVEKMRVKHPGCIFKLSLPIGAYKGMAEIIQKQLKSKQIDPSIEI
jgi:sirohydrochlorin ferrochelatase